MWEHAVASKCKSFRDVWTIIALNLKTEEYKIHWINWNILETLCPLPVCSPGCIRYCKAVAQVTGNTSQGRKKGQILTSVGTEVKVLLLGKIYDTHYISDQHMSELVSYVTNEWVINKSGGPLEIFVLRKGTLMRWNNLIPPSNAIWTCLYTCQQY